MKTRDDHTAKWDPEQAPPDIWQHLSRVVFVLVVLAIVPCVYAIFWPELEKQRELAEGNAALERKVAELAEMRDTRDRRLEWIRTDRDYLEIVARDRLDLHKEGEFIFKFLRQPKP